MVDSFKFSFLLSDLSAVRHFIATDRKGTPGSNRKTSAPAELSGLDKKEFKKNSILSDTIGRPSRHTVASYLGQTDLCPR